MKFSFILKSLIFLNLGQRIINFEMKATEMFRRISNAKLGVSGGELTFYSKTIQCTLFSFLFMHCTEPDPSWFGNRANEDSNPHWTNKNWLKSRFHFSFAEYNNPRNSDFGVLRVMNDDLVQPDRGSYLHLLCLFMLAFVLSNFFHAYALNLQDSESTRTGIWRFAPTSCMAS